MSSLARNPETTVGVAFIGEMGQAVASALRTCGVRVVTTLEGRGERTVRRAHEVGVELVGAFVDLVRAADVFVSLTPPAAAQSTADDWRRLAHLAPRNALYVDANSIGPELAMTIAVMIESSGHSFVDAAINGLAANFTKSGTLFLSGGRADEVEKLFGHLVRVRRLGDEPGRASAMKMLLSGLSKGVCALHLELALTAHRLGMVDEMGSAVHQIYPGIAQLIERMLPTYAEHAERRATEMRELESTVRSTGIEPTVAQAVRMIHDQLAVIPFEAVDGSSARAIIERIGSAGERGQAKDQKEVAAGGAAI